MATALPDTSAAGGLTNTATNEGQQKTNFAALRDYLNEKFGQDGTHDTMLRTARLLSHDSILNGGIFSAVASSALTLTMKGRDGNTLSATNPFWIGQRSATAGNGDFNVRVATANFALTVSSGSLLGQVNNSGDYLYAYVIDNAGTEELAISAKWFGTSGIVTTVAEGGAGAADSGTTMYSASARTSVPYRCFARLKAPQTTAGTWAANPTSIEQWPFRADDDAKAYRLGPRGHLAGLKISNGTDAVNDIDISVGMCRDSTDTVDIVLTAALGKQLDVAFSALGTPGSPAGGRTGAGLADGTRHVFVVRKADGTVDGILDDSATAPTLPTDFIYFRRIGSVVRASAAIKGFKQFGDYFRYLVPVADVNNVAPAVTTAVTRTLTLPLGIEALAQVGHWTNNGTANINSVLSALDETDTAASVTNFTARSVGGAAAYSAATEAYVKTNTSAQIRSRQDASGAADTISILTKGWIDLRGRSD